MKRLLLIPTLTPTRISIAITLAMVADGVQFALGPAGFIVVTQVIDVVAMILMTWIIGFHPLFLPTFVAEFIPVVDMLPTWTACVTAVIALRKRQQRATAPPPPPPGRPQDSVIDV